MAEGGTRGSDAATALDSWRPAAGEPVGFAGVTAEELSSREISRAASWQLLDTRGQPAPQSYHLGRVDVRDARNLAGYVSAGLLMVASALSLDVLEGTRIGTHDETVTRRSRGGHVWRRVGPS